MSGNGWSTLQLGQFLTFQRGYDITKKEQQEGPYFVFSSSGPNSTHTKAKVKGPGVIIGRKGTLGAAFYSSQDYWPHDTTLWVKDFHGNNPLFAFYFVKTLRLEQYDCGASNPTINRNHIHSLPVRVPSLPIQERIAHTLSAYDDLIENNARRIAILEEMTRSLYREWFVNFRFPGHENAEMVESVLGAIPAGWHVAPMSTVADVIDCLHSKKPDAIEVGTGILLQLFNIADGGKLDLSHTYRISDEDYIQWTSRIEAQEGDCVITNVGRIAAVAQVPPGVKAALGRNMTAVRPKSGVLAPTFLIEYLLSSHMENEVHQKKDAGAIMDSLNVRAIVKLRVPMPPSDLMEAFENLARPLRRHIELLVQQKHNLRFTRDLLLPRLISGKLDVSGLDIDTWS